VAVETTALLYLSISIRDVSIAFAEDDNGLLFR